MPMPRTTDALRAPRGRATTPDAGALARFTCESWDARASALRAWDALPIARPLPATPRPPRP
jgi:hypothetical protein